MHLSAASKRRPLIRLEEAGAETRSTVPHLNSTLLPIPGYTVQHGVVLTHMCQMHEIIDVKLVTHNILR